MLAIFGSVMRAALPLAVAYALPALASPPDGTRPQPPVLFVSPSVGSFPLPGTRSPLDTVTISTFVKPPSVTAVGSAAPLFPITLGSPQPSYIVDLDARFDGPLVRELPNGQR